MISATRPRGADEADRQLWSDRTLPSYLDEAVGDDALAVVDATRSLTYGDLRESVACCAGAFEALGVRPGDVVGVMLPNWWEALVAMHAALRCGAVVNPIVPIYRESEVSFMLAQAKHRLFVIPDRFRGFDYVEMMRRVVGGCDGPVPRVLVVRAEQEPPGDFIRFESIGQDLSISDRSDANDIALLLYTSGTTAQPKGVLHSHQTLDYENRSIIELFGLDRSDAVFMPSPLTHITGLLYGVLLPPMLGVPVVLLDQWDPETALHLIEANGCTWTLAATPFLQSLTDAYAERGITSSLRTFACGGADVPPELVRRARSVLDALVVRIYGSSEFPTLASGSAATSTHVAEETDGVAIGAATWRIDGAREGIGELLVRGPELFVGYLDADLNDEAFTDDGYFRTGDLASADGTAIVIRGRKKDIIIRGGENISAKEVEDLLYEHPGIVEVAIVGMPDRAMGEKACAFVVPRPGWELTLADLTGFLDGRHIAKQKYPERLEVVAELPKTASGKVQKYVLRERVRSSVLSGVEHG
jgi:cyclohexanecarboxylate-CoA ligase